MMYAKVDAARTKIIELGPRPDWHIDGEPVSDAILAAGGIDEVERDGWVPIIREAPEYDGMFQRLQWDEQHEWVIETDRVVQTFKLIDIPLTSVKNSIEHSIDSMADGARSAFLTQGGPGQALEYDETRREIEVWAATVDPDIDDFPMLRAEYRARQVAEPDITVEQVVSDTQAEIAIWKQVGSAIKEIRRTAKVALEVAETRERIKQVHDWAAMAFQSAAMTGQFEPLPSVA